ncbi:hypothetical protein PMKS-000145 [Pichia membranifaciens]|uniref:Uncharacterized protein n=1 Tax=Pichia membranifaciens TaxID=4926 RepID=A0A1Q2YAY5_9ASCO|nr:hypothetical protein PMKS-000145 [Pichia membranifaciens]
MSDSELEKQTPAEAAMQKRLFTFFFSKKVPPIPQDGERKVLPERKVNPISQFLFLWMNPLLVVGYKRTLQYEDCFKMDDEEKVDKLYLTFVGHLESLKNGDKKVTKMMLLKALHSTLIFDTWSSLVIKVISDVATCCAPLLLKKLTDFVEYSTLDDNVYYGTGAGYAVGVALLITLGSLTTNYSFYRATVLSCKVRSILTRALLEKSFSINAHGFHKFPSSRINSIMSTDLSRVDLGLTITIIVLLCIIPIAITIALLIVNIGVSALAGIACFFIVFVILGISFKSLVKLRKKASIYTDIRVKLTKEFLTNFKMIKFYSWENSYRERIEDARKKEVKINLSMQFIKNLLMSVALGLPNLSSMVAFLTVSRVSPQRSSGDIFSSFAFFQNISTVFFQLPMAIGGAANVKVAFQRVADFLSCDDVDLKQFELKLLEDEKLAIQASECDFEWETFDDEEDEDDGDDDKKDGDKKSHKKSKAESKHIMKVETKGSASSSFEMCSTTNQKVTFSGLKNVNFQISKGEFVVVAGSVGSGKSSLLCALSGFMKRTKGELSVNGNSILCGRLWIKNDTIRENILFGLPYDTFRYQQVIDACCLQPDFDQFAGGDLTEVGERGITLSGGQKARICLARSVYADRDIIYLDDVLSAVDAKVGKHIVEKCICGFLRNKTVILATHQINLAKKANRMIFLNGDGTLEIGQLDELKAKYSAVSSFFEKVTIEKKKGSNVQGVEVHQAGKSVDAHNGSNNNENGVVRIIGDEEKAVNGLAFSVYKTYYNLGVGFFKISFLPLFISLVVLSTFTTYFSNVWLAYWIERHFAHRSYGFYSGIYILMNLMFVILIGAEFIMLGYFCVTAAKKLNLGAMRRILHAPVVFMDISPLGRVLNRFTKDTDVLDNEIIDQMRMAIYPIGMMVGVFILCIIYLPWFAIAIPILVFLYIFITVYYQASSRELKRIDALRRSLVFTQFNESIEGLETIKAYNRKSYFVNQLNVLMDNNNEVYFLTWAIQRWLAVNFSLLTLVFILVISLLCCFRVFNISAADTGLLLSYSITIPSFLQLAVRCLAQIETEFNSVERLDYYATEMVQEAAYEIPENDPPASWPQNGQIEFKNVSLKYRPELPYVVKDLNLSFKGGEKVGFCGRTGAGKSTFMTCLYRLTEFEGAIAIDGVDISQLGLHKLRSNMTIIPQDPVLFVGSIRSNLDPFNEYDDDTLWNALVTSSLIEESELAMVKPQTKEDKIYHKFHLDRDVEDNGSNFSLGEKQLIALARAVVRKTKILILDEATSSVDYITDDKIQNAIATRFNDCTVLSIAHRLKTILSFDKIVVMDNGEVIQFGEPKELFDDRDGLFRSMCAQSGIDENDFD